MTLLRAALAVAIAASMALVLDYKNARQPTFCGDAGGCAAVQNSKLGADISEFLAAYVGGVGLPQIGLFAFLGLLVFSFFLRPGVGAGSVGPDGRTYAQPTFIRGRVAVLAGIAAVGGLLAAGLVVAQATIHAFCLYCMIVDTSMMFAAACAIILWRTADDEDALKRSLQPATHGVMIGVWSGVAFAAVMLPFLWTLYPVVPPLPKEIQALQEPGKITVVSMTDFECPHCRRLSSTLTEVRKNPDVAFKRIMVPLPFHPSAGFAARSYLCVPEELREEMAHKLYEAEFPLSGEGYITMATDLGVTREEFVKCADAEETSEEVARQAALFSAIHGEGLPLTYVGRYAVVGAEPSRLLAAVRSARSNPPELPPWLVFVLLGALVGGATVYAWRRCDDVLFPPVRNIPRS